MSTRIESSPAIDGRAFGEAPNGAAVAAFVAAGIGSFAVGLFVILSEAEIFAAPTLYEPAGGVSGRTTFAAGVWLIAWLLLHARWRNRDIAARGAFMLTLVLIALGILATFPLVWGIF